MVMAALGKNALFFSAVLPKQVFPPLFNRYDAGMTFGSHVDNAIRGYLDTPLQVRTDVSSTLFISAPEDYDGGELVVEDTYGTHKVKLPAGDMIVYPGTSLHHVTPITRGSRIASFFWTQSLIRDDTQRALLFDLDMAIRRLTADHPEHPSRGERSPRSITTCCGNGRRCEMSPRLHRTLGRLLAVSWLSLGCLLAVSWLSLGCLLAVSWLSLGRLLAVILRCEPGAAGRASKDEPHCACQCKRRVASAGPSSFEARRHASRLSPTCA